jgi:hypothetical protein
MESRQSTFAASFKIKKRYAKENFMVRLDLNDGKHSTS